MALLGLTHQPPRPQLAGLYILPDLLPLNTPSILALPTAPQLLDLRYLNLPGLPLSIPAFLDPAHLTTENSILFGKPLNVVTPN